MFKLIVRLALLAMVAPLMAASANAQAKFPERTIRLVVPFAAGGGVDTYARLIAQRLQDKLSGAVIVENRAGANSTLGGNYVMQAAPDGYTLLFSASTHISARLVMAKAPYDPIADFTPVARVGLAPMLVIMAPNKPQKTSPKSLKRRASARRVERRDTRARFARAPCDDRLRQPCGLCAADHSLSRHRAGAERRRGRARPALHRRHDRAVADGAGRQRQAARHHGKDPQQARARNSDHRRKRHAGARHSFLVRGLGPKGMPDDLVNASTASSTRSRPNLPRTASSTHSASTSSPRRPNSSRASRPTTWRERRAAQVGGTSSRSSRAVPHGCGMFFCLSHWRISPISRFWVAMISRAKCWFPASLPNLRTISAMSIAP